MLRPSLVPGMLAMIAGNLNRDVSDVRLFELGTVFSGTTREGGRAAGAGIRSRGQFAGGERAARAGEPSSFMT